MQEKLIVKYLIQAKFEGFVMCEKVLLVSLLYPRCFQALTPMFLNTLTVVNFFLAIHGHCCFRHESDMIRALESTAERTDRRH